MEEQHLQRFVMKQTKLSASHSYSLLGILQLSLDLHLEVHYRFI